jgi:hypothetical protein
MGETYLPQGGQGALSLLYFLTKILEKYGTAGFPFRNLIEMQEIVK